MRERLPSGQTRVLKAYRVTEPSRSRDEDPAVAELRRSARDMTLRGKYRKAAGLYEQLLEHNSGDAQCVLRLAELRRKIGDQGGARVAYQLAISLYLDAGWDRKAIAIEHALEHLRDTPPEPRLVTRWRSLWTWLVVVWHACARPTMAAWRRVRPSRERLRWLVESICVRLAYGRRPELRPHKDKC